MEKKTIGTIGSGRIVQALLDGLMQKELLGKSQIWVSSPSALNDKSPLKRYANRIQLTTSNVQLCQNCDVVLLGVKPKMIKSVCQSLAQDEFLGVDRLQKILFVSVVPGLIIDTLCQWLGTKNNVIRIMYNVNVATCSGSYAISVLNNEHRQSQSEFQSLFDQVAFFAGQVSESELDIMCALIASGPAFFCTAVEGLADGAVKAGLSRSLANVLAARTMLGCADLLVTSSKHPAQLKEEISTPGGTTIHGLHELENKGVRGAYMDALMAAFNRAQTMADQLAKEMK